MDRPKFLRHCANGVQLRVEQIGPNLWGGAVYIGLFPGEILGTPEPRHQWDVFTALREDDAKDGAMATIQRLGCDGGDESWRVLSDVTDAVWADSLSALGFPGYPEREGMERWSGF
jgi:hypothetical protein